jgi:polyisoprenoid-binding protein YceI
MRRMARWTFEPGHTAAEFCVRHMMVTWVRGHFKDVHGTLDFDAGNPRDGSVSIDIDATRLWTGEPARDAHLRSADFLDVDHHPRITFRSTGVEVTGFTEFTVAGDLTIRGTTRPVTLHVQYLGEWATPFWEDGVDKGPMLRAGFQATARINRHDFGVSWNSPLAAGGLVVGNDVLITIDAEAIRPGPGSPLAQ